VFMDAHMPVTHKEGDRYPLRPPLLSVIKVIVIGRYDYSTVRVRPTLSDITAIRSPVLATFLANRHDST